MPRSPLHSLPDRLHIARASLAANPTLTVRGLREHLGGGDPVATSAALKAARIERGDFGAASAEALATLPAALQALVQLPAPPPEPSALDDSHERLAGLVTEHLNAAHQALSENVAYIWRSAARAVAEARADAERVVRGAHDQEREQAEVVADLRRETAEALQASAEIRLELEPRISELERHLEVAAQALAQADTNGGVARGALERVTGELRQARRKASAAEQCVVVAEARAASVAQQVGDLQGRLTAATIDLRDAREAATRCAADAAMQAGLVAELRAQRGHRGA